MDALNSMLGLYGLINVFPGLAIGRNFRVFTEECHPMHHLDSCSAVLSSFGSYFLARWRVKCYVHCLGDDLVTWPIFVRQSYKNAQNR